jgi:hypothetical protein
MGPRHGRGYERSAGDRTNTLCDTGLPAIIVTMRGNQSRHILKIAAHARRGWGRVRACRVQGWRAKALALELKTCWTTPMRSQSRTDRSRSRCGSARRAAPNTGCGGCAQWRRTRSTLSTRSGPSVKSLSSWLPARSLLFTLIVPGTGGGVRAVVDPDPQRYVRADRVAAGRADLFAATPPPCGDRRRSRESGPAGACSSPPSGWAHCRHGGLRSNSDNRDLPSLDPPLRCHEQHQDCEREHRRIETAPKCPLGHVTITAYLLLGAYDMPDWRRHPFALSRVGETFSDDRQGPESRAVTGLWRSG